MKKQIAKKLTLSRETVSSLEKEVLIQVHGATMYTCSCPKVCISQ